MRIIQISDSHISVDHPARTADLATCVATINELPNAPDVVIHSGDIAHDGLPEEYRIAKDCLDKLVAPYHVMVGNRDNRRELISAFANGDTINQTDKFVQYSIESYATRLIVVDTLNEQSNKGQLCEQRLAHLEQMLAADTSRPVLVFLHHTPFEVPPIPDPFQFHDWSEVKKLEKLLATYPSVTGIFCGHVHRNVDGTIGNLPASAISCMARDLRKGKLNDEERNRPMYKVISTTG